MSSDVADLQKHASIEKHLQKREVAVSFRDGTEIIIDVVGK